mgnify:CR=1 FL=1|tara:strand:- start:170 stop:445 length:276 start_codon:yes stop_codon:yes gene_type:complete
MRFKVYNLGELLWVAKRQPNPIELLRSAIPYPKQIKKISNDAKGNIYFTWRDGNYKLEVATYSVWLVDGCCMSGDNTSILIEHLLKTKLNQ